MKAHIDYTEFGQINIDGIVYEYDVVIRQDGSVEKRNKKLSREVYGTSHTLSLEEAEFIYEEGTQDLIIGSGQYGVLELSVEAANYFKERGVQIKMLSTPESMEVWNDSGNTSIGVFHITC